MLNDGALLDKAEEEFKRKPVIPKSIFGEINTMSRNPSVRLIPMNTKSKDEDYIERSMANESRSAQSRVSRHEPPVPSSLGKRFASQPKPSVKAKNSIDPFDRSDSDSYDEFKEQQANASALRRKTDDNTRHGVAFGRREHAV